MTTPSGSNASSSCQSESPLVYNHVWKAKASNFSLLFSADQRTSALQNQAMNTCNWKPLDSHRLNVRGTWRTGCAYIEEHQSILPDPWWVSFKPSIINMKPLTTLALLTASNVSNPVNDFSTPVRQGISSQAPSVANSTSQPQPKRPSTRSGQ